MEKNIDLYKKLKDDFILFNSRKLAYLFNNLDRSSQKIIHTISFLLNTNSNEFPGFIKNSQTPFGIDGYNITEDAIADVSDILKKPNALIYDSYAKNEERIVKSLFLMGSTGSIGQTKKSDFDYWVVIDENEDSTRTDELSNKLKLIEQWIIGNTDLEIHLFLANGKDIKANFFGKTDNESAGSALGKMLKDEFYRTSILIFGRIPYFWITDNNLNEREYNSCISNIKTLYPEFSKKFIDFGDIYKFEYEEYYGAILWQIFKSVGSSFKSVIKMGLIHYYFNNRWPSSILSNELKIKIHSKSLTDSYLDPYIMMFQKVYSFYEEKGDKKTLEILKKSFLLKIGIKLSKDEFDCNKNNKEIKKFNYKKDTLLSFLTEWNWGYEKYLKYQSEEDLTFEDNIALGEDISEYLISTYKEIYDQIIGHSEKENKINQNDLNFLGKIISSRISPKKGKVKFLKLSSRKNAIVKNLTLCTLKEDKKKKWHIYLGHLSINSIISMDEENTLLFKSTYIADILACLVNNRITDNDTSFMIYEDINSMDVGEFKRLLLDLNIFFIPIKNINISYPDLFKGEYIKKIYYLVNLTWTSSGEEDINEVSILYQNSLGEMFIQGYSGKEGVLESIKFLTTSLPPKIGDFSDYFRVYVKQGGSSYLQKLYFTKILNKELLNKIGERRKKSRSKIDFIEDEDIFNYFEKQRRKKITNKLDISYD